MPDVIEQLRSYGDGGRGRRASGHGERAAEPAAVPAGRRRAGARGVRGRRGVGPAGRRRRRGRRPGGGHHRGAGGRVRLADPRPGPLEAREGSAVVWTGQELVVWGGTRTDTGIGFADGAAFDPVTGEWRMMSPPPVDRGGLVGGVWTGEEVLVWSAEIDGETDDLADWTVLAWDPATDEWRTAGGRCLVGGDVRRCPDAMPDRPWGVGVLEPVWTGEGVIDIGIGAAYDPATDVWRMLPERPVLGTPNAVTWTGDALVVLVANRSDASFPPGESVAVAYDPGPTLGGLAPYRRRRERRRPDLGRPAPGRPRLRDAGRHLPPRRRRLGGPAARCRCASTSARRDWHRWPARCSPNTAPARLCSPRTGNGRSPPRWRIPGARWCRPATRSCPGGPATTTATLPAPCSRPTGPLRSPTTTSPWSARSRSAPSCSTYPTMPGSRAPGSRRRPAAW